MENGEGNKPEVEFQPASQITVDELQKLQDYWRRIALLDLNSDDEYVRADKVKFVEENKGLLEKYPGFAPGAEIKILEGDARIAGILNPNGSDWLEHTMLVKDPTKPENHSFSVSVNFPSQNPDKVVTKSYDLRQLGVLVEQGAPTIPVRLFTKPATA